MANVQDRMKSIKQMRDYNKSLTMKNQVDALEIKLNLLYDLLKHQSKAQGSPYHKKQ